jgi:hypothetical protein
MGGGGVLAEREYLLLHQVEKDHRHHHDLSYVKEGQSFDHCKTSRGTINLPDFGT